MSLTHCIKKKHSSRKKNALVKIASCMGYSSSSEGLLTCCLPACTVVVNKSWWPPQTCTWDRGGFLHVATQFTLLGCFANYKFRLCAGKWVFPGAVYIRSDKDKGVHQKNLFSHFHAITQQTLSPADQLNQCPMSLERKNSSRGIERFVKKNGRDEKPGLHKGEATIPLPLLECV